MLTYHDKLMAQQERARAEEEALRPTPEQRQQATIKAGETMAREIMRNAAEFLNGNRNEFSAWLVPTEASHEVAAERLASMIALCPHGNVNDIEKIEEDNWNGAPIVTMELIVARNGNRQISVTESLTDVGNGTLERAQTRYLGAQVTSASSAAQA